MDWTHPLRVVTPALDGDVLAVLARANRAFTGREVQRQIPGASVDGVWRALRRLSEQGVVEGQRAGSAILYRLNRDHLAAPAIEALANLRLELLERLRRRIATWEIPSVAALLFGSAARGEGSARSDLDLFIVRPAGIDAGDDVWRDQLMSLEAVATRWTGNDARIFEVGEDELPTEIGAEPVVDAALEEGIELAGTIRTLRRRRTGART